MTHGTSTDKGRYGLLHKSVGSLRWISTRQSVGSLLTWGMGSNKSWNSSMMLASSFLSESSSANVSIRCLTAPTMSNSAGLSREESMIAELLTDDCKFINHTSFTVFELLALFIWLQFLFGVCDRFGVYVTTSSNVMTEPCTRVRY
jgi:hypothetical protein